MAKITITFEDIGNGKVKVVSDPTFETMAKMNLSGHEWTGAQGYALCALNAVRRASKSQEPTTNIIIPRIGRG